MDKSDLLFMVVVILVSLVGCATYIGASSYSDTGSKKEENKKSTDKTQKAELNSLVLQAASSAAKIQLDTDKKQSLIQLIQEGISNHKTMKRIACDVVDNIVDRAEDSSNEYTTVRLSDNNLDIVVTRVAIAVSCLVMLVHDGIQIGTELAKDDSGFVMNITTVYNRLSKWNELDWIIKLLMSGEQTINNFENVNSNSVDYFKLTLVFLLRLTRSIGYFITNEFGANKKVVTMKTLEAIAESTDPGPLQAIVKLIFPCKGTPAKKDMD